MGCRGLLLIWRRLFNAKMPSTTLKDNGWRCPWSLDRSGQLYWKVARSWRTISATKTHKLCSRTWGLKWHTRHFSSLSTWGHWSSTRYSTSIHRFTASLVFQLAKSPTLSRPMRCMPGAFITPSGSLKHSLFIASATQLLLLPMCTGTVPITGCLEHW